jgi:type IV pilus assembly protein PilW
MTTPSTKRGCRARGFTLIEMMVALVVGMVVVLSVVAVQKAFENQRRTATSGTDLDNAGANAMSELDGLLRSAGSGFTQAYTQTFGCQIYASKGGASLLPTPVLGEPFSNVLGAAGVPLSLGGAVRMAPVVILPGNTDATQLNQGNGTSDVLMIMSGGGSAANLQTTFTAVPTATGLTLTGTAAFAANDIVLVMDTTQPTGPANCLIEQVAAGFTGGAGVTALPLSGTFYSDGTVPPTAFSIEGAAVSLGNPAGNPPSFQVVGVASGNQLEAYDLLNIQSTTAVPIADNVMELHAVYLTQSAGGNGYVGVSPTTVGYRPGDLMAGTLAASTNLNNIKAVRIGLILKSPLLEQMINVGGIYQHVAPPSVTLFSDLSDGSGNPLAYTRVINSAAPKCNVPGAASANKHESNMTGGTPLATCEADYRYRTVELTIPLRNPLLY